MVAFPGFTRPMRAGEEAAVDALLQEAFGGHDEARLVDLLRREGDMAGEMVLPLGDGIIGYYGLSRMRGPQGWLCLAPVAIEPAHQGRGHGRRMIGQLAEWARRSGTHVVFLGQVPFYARAGFSAERARNLGSPYPITHTLMAGPGEDAPNATLAYPNAFSAI